MTGSPEWISVGALGDAFARESNALPVSAGLAGRTLSLHFENGWLIEHRFETDSVLRRTVRDAGTGTFPTSPGAVAYSATEIRPRIFFVNFVEPQLRAATVTLLLDLDNRICTAVIGRLPTRAAASVSLQDRIARGAELTGVSATFIHGAIDLPFVAASARHVKTADLLGKRVRYTYSSTESYEHIYLNESFYTWHCLAGSERGLADTDRCDHLKLAPNLYLFAWREKIVPTFGIVVVDLEQMKTTGRILGYRDFDFGVITNFPVGARARIVGA
jgi:hypothetical protein